MPARMGRSPRGVLDNIIENYKIADAENVPICQDTGYGLCVPGDRTGCTSDRRRSLQKQLMKVYAEVMIKDIYENL